MMAETKLPNNSSKTTNSNMTTPSNSNNIKIEIQSHQTSDGKPSNHHHHHGKNHHQNHDKTKKSSSSSLLENNLVGQQQQTSNSNDQQQPNKQQQNNSNANKKRKLNNQNHHNQHQNSDSIFGGGGVASNYNGGQPGQYLAGHRLTGSPAWDLQPQNNSAQTFTGRCRLFVANLPSNVTEEALRKLFSEFGQISDIFIGKGNQFAFIKMDTRSNAENAKNAWDGKQFEGRTLRVRLAAHAAAIKVTNLPPCVSNELLHYAFSTFGPIERAIVVADDRGRSLNEGIIEFARKSSAQAAIKKCQNECLLLSSTPIPVIATSLESRDEEEGVPEKNVLHQADYRKERELGPRFTEPNTVENEIAKKWKEFTQHEQDRRQAFEAEMQDMRENFKVQMEYFRLEEETKQLREQLRQMEAQVQQFNAERDARYDYERQREDQRRQHENVLRQQEEQLVGGQHHTQNDLNVLRRQESDLRQQANALQQLLDRQEKSLRQIDPSLGQHMESNMYGQPGLVHGVQPPPSQMMPGGGTHAGQMPGPPGANPMAAMAHGGNPYGPQHPTQVNHYPPPPPPPPQQQQHPQMNHHHPYGHPHHPHQAMQQQASRPPPPVPIVPYNGVPPPTMVPPPQVPYGSQQGPQQQQQGGNNACSSGGMNHSGGNYGKRTRRY